LKSSESPSRVIPDTAIAGIVIVSDKGV